MDNKINDTNHYRAVNDVLLKEAKYFSVTYIRAYLKHALNSQNEELKYLPVFADYEDFSRRFKNDWFSYGFNDSFYSVDYYKSFKMDRDVLYQLVVNQMFDKPFIWNGDLKGFQKEFDSCGICTLEDTQELCRTVVSRLQVAIAKGKMLHAMERDKETLKEFYLSLTNVQRLEFLHKVPNYTRHQNYVSTLLRFNSVKELKKAGLYDKDLFEKHKFKEGDVITVTLEGKKLKLADYWNIDYAHFAGSMVECIAKQNIVVATLKSLNLNLYRNVS